MKIQKTILTMILLKMTDPIMYEHMQQLSTRNDDQDEDCFREMSS